MDQLFVLLGTLLGAVVGAAGTWLVQKDAYRQQARDKQRDIERAVVVQWLATSHKVYQIEQSAQRQLARDGDQAAYKAAFDAAPAAEALAALEELRLVCEPVVRESAESEWLHLRSTAAQFMNPEKPMNASQWREVYYDKKREFTEAARDSLAR
jgi:hypothetical protein